MNETPTVTTAAHASPSAPRATTVLFDTEKSAESYIHLYANEPGVQGPLWPAPIPIIGVSGRLASGKTTFLLDIAGGPIKRIDLPLELMKAYPNGYRPIDAFTFWHSLVKKIKPGQFRVIAIDVAEEIEQGVADYVFENAIEFGATRKQFELMSGMFQAKVSSYWKTILADLASRCETFAFANHIGLEWSKATKQPTGKEKNKGRPVLAQLASLYLKLQRERDPNTGITPAFPSAMIDVAEGGKSRLMMWGQINGMRAKVPVLPPRLPIATPDAIRGYFVAPPDYAKLAPEQRAPEKPMTEHDRMQLNLQIAEARAAAANAEIESYRQQHQQDSGRHNEQAEELIAVDKELVVDDAARLQPVPLPPIDVPPPVPPMPEVPMPMPPTVAAPSPAGTGVAAFSMNIDADMTSVSADGTVVVTEAASSSPTRSPASLPVPDLLTSQPHHDIDTKTPPETLQDTMSAQVPSIDPNTGKRRTPKNKLERVAWIRDCWAEITHWGNIDQTVADSVFAKQIKAAGCSQLGEMSNAQLSEMMAKMAVKLRALYEKAGRLADCPF